MLGQTIRNMHLLFWITTLLGSGTSLILATSPVSPVIKERLNTGHTSKVITCEALTPAVDLFWTYPNGTRIEYSPNNQVYSVINEGKVLLVVHKLAYINEGGYTCNSYEEPGLHLQNTYYLENAGPPEFDVPSENIRVVEGTPIEILCQATGDPVPSYIWYNHKGEAIVENKDGFSIESVENGVILSSTNITSETEGLYSCSAHNTHGVVTKIFNITVICRPENTSIISNITVLEVTANSVTFDIEIENAQANESEIYVKYSNSFNETITSSWMPGDKWEVLNLIASDKYDFRFRVTLDEEWTKPLRVVLFPGMPDVIVESLSDGNFVLDFNRNVNDFYRGTIDKFRVTYATISMRSGNIWVPSQCNMSVEIPQCIGSKYLIAGLFDKLYYNIWVEAHTSAGYGEPYIQKIFVKRNVKCCS